MWRVTGGRRGRRSPAAGDGETVQLLSAVAVAAALVLGTAAPASAHAPGELDRQLLERERYFQPMNHEAPGFTLQDADGRTVRLADLRGKVVVLHFIYASCPDVCPLHAERIAEIQGMINRTPMKDQVQFVSITTDPARDTPDILRQFGPAHGLDPSNWLFLTAASDQADDSTRKLAKAYGLEFTTTENGEQMHAVVTHVIDQGGHLRARFFSLKFEPTSLVLFVNDLVDDAWSERPRPGFWERLRGLLGS
ncbi:MAG: SCO family protein [Geminicoccaceae bacterium]